MTGALSVHSFFNALITTATVIVCFSLPAQAEPNTSDPLPKPTINGSDKAAENAARTLMDPLSGVVVNRTVTVFGNDFYQAFASVWREKPEADKFSISIHERPTARFGSEIWIEYRRKRMFHAFLSPARSQARSISRQAVELVYENISRSEVERALIRSPDLGPEEL